jgi:hypothetical protein
VQEGWIIGTQRRSHRRVSLVTRGADRVEALPAAPQEAGYDVEVPAAGLRLEQLDGACAGETRS